MWSFDRTYFRSLFTNHCQKIRDDWVADEISFSNVTISLGKIQFLNQNLNHYIFPSLIQHITDTNYIIPKGEDHIYGGIAATSEITWDGYRRIFNFDFKKNELENLLCERNYDFIGISSANNFMIEKINNLSSKISAVVERKTPIVLGGNLAVPINKQTIDFDFITQNLEEILKQLSLKYKNKLRMLIL